MHQTSTAAWLLDRLSGRVGDFFGIGHVSKAPGVASPATGLPPGVQVKLTDHWVTIVPSTIRTR